MEKDIIAIIGIILGFLSYAAYIHSIFKGNTVPHPVSWFIWGLLTAIAFVAQLWDHGGVGSYITGMSALISLVIALIGFLKRKNITIHKNDIVILIFSLLAIPLWLITNTPLWSVILITTIDAIGFYPTFRKTWHNPEQEPRFSYIVGGIKHLLTLLALENYSVITGLYPLSLFIMNYIFIAMLYYRRWIIKNHA